MNFENALMREMRKQGKDGVSAALAGLGNSKKEMRKERKELEAKLQCFNANVKKSNNSIKS